MPIPKVNSERPTLTHDPKKRDPILGKDRAQMTLPPRRAAANRTKSAGKPVRRAFRATDL